MTKIFLPTSFLELTSNKRFLEIDGETAGEVLENLANIYHPIRKFIFSNQGKINSFINVYLNDEDIKYLNDADTKVYKNDRIKIVPSIAGGE